MAVPVRGNPWRRVGLTLCGMAFVLLLVASWRYVVSRGVFTSVPDVSPGKCETVPGIPSVSDIAIDKKSDAAYVGSKDGIYIFTGGKPVRFKTAGRNIKPESLSSVPGPDASVVISALVKSGNAWAISIYNVNVHTVVEGTQEKGTKGVVTGAVPLSQDNPPGLDEVGRMSADLLNDPVALASLDSDRFYLINRHGTHTGLGRWLDDTFLLPRANILWFDGMKFVTVAARLNSPAGLALSPDGTHLYVAEDYLRTLVSFTRNDFTGALDNPQALSIASGLQKISVSPNGDLLIAARPKAGAGQVWRVQVQNGVPQSAQLIYSKKGEDVTAAAELDGHLLIGTGGHLIDCPD